MVLLLDHPCVAVCADLVPVIPFPFVLSTVFVDGVPSFVLFVGAVAVCVNISIVLLCIKSRLSLSLLLTQTSFCHFFCIPSFISLNFSAFSLPFLELLASNSGRFSLHFKSKRFICLCHYW